MKRIYLIILGCIATSMLQAQELSGQYTTVKGTKRSVYK